MNSSVAQFSRCMLIFHQIMHKRIKQNCIKCINKLIRYNKYILTTLEKISFTKYIKNKTKLQNLHILLFERMSLIKKISNLKYFLNCKNNNSIHKN
ncbi:hypothetical protein PFNF135_03328 [Plasmodium falciparum NF135/5.C10]|uniref:Uncharacterized protein n=1 Tax=Plasmodium falciparum NF135/5.C10 TaxID=1036726 RepID=W4IF26_PLAFA|nr:hypothetical protein PFNF135_03328 [Plasmodium falciparum NF135/5.C10]